LQLYLLIVLGDFVHELFDLIDCLLVVGVSGAYTFACIVVSWLLYELLMVSDDGLPMLNGIVG
jgi:hypothetical protein